MSERTPEQEQARYNDLTPTQAAEQLGISPSQVRRFILSGQIEARDIGFGKVPRYRITQAAINKFNRIAKDRVVERVKERRDDVAA